MKYTVSVIKWFASAHALRGYKGRCENLHGHNWKVRVSLSSHELDPIGMVVDFTDIKAHAGEVIRNLDHTYLNEHAPFDTINPTAENIASYIFKEMKKIPRPGVTVESVEVWESESSCATVTEQ